MFWYLSMAMAAKLTNVAETKAVEMNAKMLHWKFLIFDFGTKELITNFVCPRQMQDEEI